MGHIMLTEVDFANDVEFTKLLARRDDVDLTVAALELARDAYPQLDFSATLDWISRRAGEIAPKILQAPNEELALGLLADCLAAHHGLSGSRAAYLQPDGSYLNRVIETGRGIPISLSVIYMAVANQAGLGLHGVAAPGHFMTRYEAVDGPLFIDAFADGEVLNLDQMLLRVTLTTGMSEERALTVLEPASARTIIIRMLNNLKAIHSQTENWNAAWKVQYRLAALQPGSYEERRDLGLISVKANRPGSAVDLLEKCLKSASGDDASAIEFQLAEARRKLSEWN